MDHLTDLFCFLDDFCKEFEPAWRRHLLDNGRRTRRRRCGLCLSELMTLLVLFHQIRYRQFKMFYLHHARTHLRSAFPRMPSY